MVCAPVATGNDEWPESLRSLPGHTVVLHVSIRSLGSQTPVVPPWPHQEGNEGRMLGFASQPGFGKALGGMFPSPRPGASGHLDGRLEPVLSRLVLAARLLCLVFGASQHPRRQWVLGACTLGRVGTV